MFFKDLLDGIKSVFTKNTEADNAFRLDGRVPLKRAMPFGLQHVLAMFVSNVTGMAENTESSCTIKRLRNSS